MTVVTLKARRRSIARPRRGADAWALPPSRCRSRYDTPRASIVRRTSPAHSRERAAPRRLRLLAPCACFAPPASYLCSVLLRSLGSRPRRRAGRPKTAGIDRQVPEPSAATSSRHANTQGVLSATAKKRLASGCRGVRFQPTLTRRPSASPSWQPPPCVAFEPPGPPGGRCSTPHQRT